MEVFAAAQTLTISPHGEPGPYAISDWKVDWPHCEYEDGVREGRLSIVRHLNTKRFRVDYARGGIGPDKGGFGWRFPIVRRDSATLQYVLRFSDGFDWKKGGKLPGLSGGPESVTGGRPANGKNGFSCRLMWRKDGRGEAYVYHMNQKGKYGESFGFPDSFRFPTETDISVTMVVGMNHPNQRNGVLKIYVTSNPSDPKLVVDRNDIQWRSESDFGIDSVLFQSFHGGSDKTWAPNRHCWAEFGSIAVAD